MAIAEAVLKETQRQTLLALCDTFMPSVAVETHDPVERGFMARAASDLAVPEQIEGLMADVMTPEEIAGFSDLLDAAPRRGLRRR